MTTEQMIEVADSYYLVRSEGNEKLMKCSLIAEYASELGYTADGYDFRRNMEVREHIERLKVCAEVYGERRLVYKTLDVEAFIRNNSGDARLAGALRELDAYWKRAYEYAEQTAAQNRELLKEKAARETALRESAVTLDGLRTETAEINGNNTKLSAENRYLRKMLRKYLYPAVADEILKSENSPTQADTELTETAAHDFIESNLPDSFEASVAKDYRIQSESERFIERLRGMCDE